MSVHAPRHRRSFVAVVCVGALWVGALGAGASVVAARAATVEGDTPADDGEALMAELGCAACHTELGDARSIRAAAPDLSRAGDRYRLSYLFSYLRNPSRVRRHIGAARMPDFHLRDDEALALALYLDSRSGGDVGGDLPASLARAAVSSSRRVLPDAALAQAISVRQPCVLCHTYAGHGGALGPELATAGARLERSWMIGFLVSPQRQAEVADGTMPALFFRPGDTGSAHEGLAAVEPDAAEQILGIADTLEDRARPERERLDRELEEMRAAHPEIDAATGARVFAALECAACHQRGEKRPQAHRARRAPDLSQESSRVKPEWLRAYLQRPHAIRPFGVPPGSGSRMPDFDLDDAQAQTIWARLTTPATASAAATSASPAAAKRPLSAFDRVKVEGLLREKLPCLGCHGLDGSGGKVGPDLSSAGARLEPAFIDGIVRHPRSQVAGVVMPQVPMPERTLALVTAYLAGRESDTAPADYLSLIDNPTTRFSARDPGSRTYRRYCASCHGAKGGGDGFNARFLPIRPTVHADAAVLSLRPDDTLFDGIFAGGAILNRSHMMPPWGETLTRPEIHALVGHLRELCACEGPEWSRDREVAARTAAAVGKSATEGPANTAKGRAR